jgi:hypothetical protein
MRLYTRYLIAAGLLLTVISFAKASVDVLANSGYPCLGGNAQRTYKIDRNFHCPAVSGGRSTILNVAWSWPPNNFIFNFTSTEITTDADGYIYVQGNDNIGYIIHRVHSANGTLSYINGYRPASTVSQASLSHTANGFMYMSSASHSEYVQESDMTGFVQATNPITVTKPASYVPYDKWMVKANVGMEATSDDVLTYWHSTIHLFDDNTVNFSPGRPIDVVVGYNTTAEFLIVVADRTPFADYPIYSTDLVINSFISSPPIRAWFEEATLFVMSTEDFLVKNWTSTADVSYTTSFSGIHPVTRNYLMYHGGKSFAHASIGATKAEFVDIVSTTYITNTPEPYRQMPPIAQPIFSKRDNIVLYPKGVTGSNVYFEGRQWDTWGVKVAGKLPPSVVLGSDFTITGVPVYGDNCDIAVVHNNKLYGLRPLPIQNVVPIFECYNPDTGIAFFSYNNLEQTPFSIPLTQDRNSFTPYTTPIEDFATGRGLIYPLSAQLDVGTNLKGYRYWQLESYTVPISFDDNSIFCPQTVNIILNMVADEQFPEGFSNVVRAKFVSVTGISDNRVTLVAKKRNLNQAESALEIELSIAPDEQNVEQKPAQIVQEFVNNQQEAFTEQINNDVSAPQNVTLDSVTGKELDNQIFGIKNYVPPPVAPNANSPSASTNPPGSSVPMTSSARYLAMQVDLYCVLFIATALLVCVVN